MKSKKRKRFVGLWILLVLIFVGCSSVEDGGNETGENIPVSTEAPTVTDEPAATEAPVVTDEPVTTDEPEDTGVPEATNEPSDEEQTDTVEEIVNSSYQKCQEIYYKLNSSFYVGGGNLAGKDIELSGYGNGWYEVKEDGFASVRDVKNYAETVFTAEAAQDMFYQHLFEGEKPAMVEVDGKLYTQLYDGIFHLEAIKEITICVATEEYISVNMALDETLSPAEYYHMELVCKDGLWRVSELSQLYSKNGPYGEEYAALEPLASDMVIFPEDTVVPLAMGSTVSVDLNGDGVQEMVQVSYASISTGQVNGGTTGTNIYRRGLPVVRVDDYIFDEEYLQANVGHYAENVDIATWYIFDVDVNDGYKEIGLFEEGPSDDPYTTLFRYEDGVLREIGGFSDSPISESRGSWALNEGDDYQALVNSVDRSNLQIKVPGDGTIYATQRIDILETSFAEGLWKLQNGDSFAEAVLELQTREEYEFKGYENRMNSEYCPVVHGELQMFMEKALTSEVFVLTQGEKIIPYHFYPDSEVGEKNGWIEILYGPDFKERGWIYVNNHMNIYQTDASGEAQYVGSHELIDNLSFAD